MNLTIAERLRPYSHLPGTFSLLPGSSFRLEIFPCLIRVYDLATAKPRLLVEWQLDLQGPIRDFTIQLDLVKGCVRVWGFSQAGYFRYYLDANDLGNAVRLVIEKAPWIGINLKSMQESVTLQSKEHVFLVAPAQSFHPFQLPMTEHLSLGNSKSQDWDLVKRRSDLTEIFPVLYCLGQILPTFSSSHFFGTASLLKKCEEAIVSHQPETIVSAFLQLFLAGFEGICSPRCEDTDYQGILLPSKVDSMESPLILLTESFKLIRSLFIQQLNEKIFILPALPPEFHCGRLTHVSIADGELDIEWTKKMIRRLIFRSFEEKEWTFTFKSQLSSFRIREGYQDRGQRLACGSSFISKKNCVYFFDNFV